MPRRSLMSVLFACLLALPLAACVQVRFSPIPGVSLGMPMGGGGGFGNPAMRVGAPGWLVGIWAPETAGCGLGQDVLYDADGDYRSPTRFGRWFLIDTTLTVRAAPAGSEQLTGTQGLPAQPVSGQSVQGQQALGQPGFGPQEETSWEIVDAEQDRHALLSTDGILETWQRCAGASQLTRF